MSYLETGNNFPSYLSVAEYIGTIKSMHGYLVPHLDDSHTITDYATLVGIRSKYHFSKRNADSLIIRNYLCYCPSCAILDYDHCMNSDYVGESVISFAQRDGEITADPVPDYLLNDAFYSEENEAFLQQGFEAFEVHMLCGEKKSTLGDSYVVRWEGWPELTWGNAVDLPEELIANYRGEHNIGHVFTSQFPLAQSLQESDIIHGWLRLQYINLFLCSLQNNTSFFWMEETNLEETVQYEEFLTLYPHFDTNR